MPTCSLTVSPSLRLFLLFIHICPFVFTTSTFGLYKTNQLKTALEYDCLDFFVTDGFVIYRETFSVAYQLVAYCIRPLNENESSIAYQKLTNETFIDAENYTFNQLKEQHITGEQLLDWSATIDLVERYEAYLMGKSDIDGLEVYYNCTVPWFGNLCEYTFDQWSDDVFADVVYRFYESKTDSDSEPDGTTCYILLKCYRGSSTFCLDWREICDGKIDCLNDGSDEEYCWQLEMSEHTSQMNEFRCHNGMQTVPSRFFRDGLYNPDCLDRSDEKYSITFWDNCYRDPAFRCEEHTCHPARGEASLVCGDGQCVNDLRKCKNKRGEFVRYDSPSADLSRLCWDSMACLTKLTDTIDDEPCFDFCWGQCVSDVQTKCPALFQFPSEFIALGHVFFLYNKTSADEETDSIRPYYVCYDQKQCDISPLVSNITMTYRGSRCLNWNQLHFHFDDTPEWLKLITNVEHFFVNQCLKNETKDCLNSNLYQCPHSSRCISKRRLVDGVQDCMNNEDEIYNQSCSLNQTFRFRCSDEENKCISSLMINDDQEDCKFNEDESDAMIIDQQSSVEISFPMICDNFQELKPLKIDGRNETDETECQFWPCDTIYTRCNHIWNCPNGIDERNCSNSSCQSIHRICLSWIDYSRACLFDNNTDWRNHLYFINDYRLCSNLSLLNNRFDCWTDDQYLSVPFVCESLDKQPNVKKHWPTSLTHRLFGCRIQQDQILYCTLTESYKTRFYSFLAYYENSVTDIENKQVKSVTQPRLKRNAMMYFEPWGCDRGLWIRFRYDDEDYHCLCPPSYYGHRCQYQNQRVSVTLEIFTDADWQTIFNVVLLLIDDQGMIESHDQMLYKPKTDCNYVKFNNYLLYRFRPKNLATNYSVQMHVYNKLTLEYRGSWLFPLTFLFLPVHRLAVQIIIPVDPPVQCSISCGGHGQCFKYVNHNDDKTFYCRCDPGWSGTMCTIKHETCHLCAVDSLCIEQNLCVCPIGKDGPRCYLTSTICKPSRNKCFNGGSCIPTDRRRATNLFSCICPDGFSGVRCEDVDRKIIVSFHKDLIIPDSLRIFFIGQTNGIKLDQQISTFKRVPFDQTFVTIYTTVRFHSIFIALSSTQYYFVYSYHLHGGSEIEPNNKTDLSLEIHSYQRCLYIDKLLNSTLLSLHVLRRIKYYHLPCRERLNLICFYDETHLCYCSDHYDRRESICYKSNHYSLSRCQGTSNGGCLNGAECFQDRETCPISSVCSCPECFHGSRCQLTTQAFGLSLDAILGYQIHPSVPWSRQPIIVHVSVFFVSIILVVGLVGNTFSILTFQRQTIIDVGCGHYLLTSAIISLLIPLFLTFKFWTLVLTQMAIIVQQSFLIFNCRLMDFLLRVSLSTNDWLCACVAIERVFVAVKGVTFDKGQSRRMARCIIPTVGIVIILSHVYDPIHRQVLHISDEQRTWCIVTYGVFYRIFDSIILIFHFLTPFAINLISAVIIIITAARQRSIVRKEKTYREHLSEQLRLCRHLLISPCVLILLAVPRLIIALLSGCMRSIHAPWLYLIGYFISFLPPTLNFIVFVLPAETYRDECRKAIKELHRRCCSRRLNNVYI